MRFGNHADLPHFSHEPRDFPWAIRSIRSKSDFLVAKENCAAAARTVGEF